MMEAMAAHAYPPPPRDHGLADPKYGGVFKAQSLLEC